MSVSLHVRLNHRLTLLEIESASSAALCELLNLESPPLVRARFERANRDEPECADLWIGSGTVFCWIPEYEEIAAVMPFEAPIQISKGEEEFAFVNQAYVDIGWHHKKTSLCWALVAAVAVGVARKELSDIEDNSGFFTESDTQQPDGFCRSLKLDTPYLDLEDAAEALYVKLPKSVAVTEWLRELEPPTGAPSS